MLIITKAEVLSDFQKGQDGYKDAELVKSVGENARCLIYHYENMEMVNVIGERMRSSKVFDEFVPFIIPGSLGVTFHHLLKKW